MRGLAEKVRASGQPLEQFERAVRTRSFLAGSGMQAEAADRLVHACLDRNLTERDYARLERTVNDMVRQGKDMDDIVRAADQNVREGRGHGEGRDGGKQDRGAGGRDTGNSRDTGSRSLRGK